MFPDPRTWRISYGPRRLPGPSGKALRFYRGVRPGPLPPGLTPRRRPRERSRSALVPRAARGARRRHVEREAGRDVVRAVVVEADASLHLQVDAVAQAE